MVRDDGHAPADVGAGDGVVESRGEGIELTVDLDSDRLEGSLGGVAAGAPGRRGNGGHDHGGQLGGGLDRTRCFDRLGDAAGETFVAVLLQNSRQKVDRIAVDHIGGRPRLSAIHSHVEIGLVPIGEAAVGLVELRRTDPEVEECSGEAGY